MAIFSITRDSVCMGDDVDAPHKVQLELSVPNETKHLISNMINVYPLAHVVSRKVSWKCFINNIYISEIIVELDESYENQTVYINLSDNEPTYNLPVNKVHFNYINNP